MFGMPTLSCFVSRIFWIIFRLLSATVQLECPCRVLVCRSGLVEALSLETMARDGICQFFFSVDFSCISLVRKYSNKHTDRWYSTRLWDGAGPFSICDTISFSGKIKNLYYFVVFSFRMAVCVINAVLNLNCIQYALTLWDDMSE